MNDLMTVVDWSRAQFALTAMYHWLFVPLTIGLSVIVGIMETIYYRTGNERWKALTKFWMTLFGINFAIGVATGIILEFEFGSTAVLELQLVRGRHIRRSACHRGASRIFHGGYFRGCDVLRLE